MLRKVRLTLHAIALLLGGLAADAAAQGAFPLPNNASPDRIIVSFPANIERVGNRTLPGEPPLSPTISFTELDNIFAFTADARLATDSGGAPLQNQVELSNFRTLGPKSVSVDLIRGGGGVPALASGERTYVITWSGVKLETQGRAVPVAVLAKVGTAANNPASLSTNLRRNKREFVVRPNGITARALLDTFAANPGQVRVKYTFSGNDPVPGANANVVVKPVAGLSAQPAGAADPQSVVVDLGDEAPHRPENYSVSIMFPAPPLRGSLLPGFTIPPPTEQGQEDVLSANLTIEVGPLLLAPPPTERAKTEFFFDNTFTSIVNATTRKRSNVGLFALHLRPVVGLRVFNTDGRGKRPQWIALRPVFDADVDTQPIKDSQAPNRIVFGADFEWGIDAGLENANDFVQQYVFLNGVRYDSDRDFKTQTLYWQTEFQPQFLNFEQTREQRLRQFRRPCDPGLIAADVANGRPVQMTVKDCQELIGDRSLRFPLVSQYFIRPSVGYQLGGVMKRGDTVSEDVSRLFVKFGAGIELKRLLLFTLDDTYYFLQDASRRRNRNYLETRLDFNTGALFNVDLGSLQSALTFKFQRGELPPRFKPVNAFSVGFKLYR